MRPGREGVVVIVRVLFRFLLVLENVPVKFSFASSLAASSTAGKKRSATMLPSTARLKVVFVPAATKVIPTFQSGTRMRIEEYPAKSPVLA